MAVRFSGVSPIIATLRTDTSAHLRADIDTVLLAAGWTRIETLTNGYLYRLQSPQGLVATCRIQDTGATESQPLGTVEHYVEVQFGGPTFADSHGVTQGLMYGGNPDIAGGFQMIAGPCQMFISLPGKTIDNLHGGHRLDSVAGGIPAIPDNVTTACGSTGAASVTEIWWSSGIDRNGNQGLRSSRIFSSQWSFCLNGTVTSVAQGATEDYRAMPLQLLTLTETLNTDFGSYERARNYADLSPLILDATLACRWKMVGQLWDAFQKSAPGTLDALTTTTETDASGNSYTATWQCWNNGPDGGSGQGTWYASLYLLRGAPLLRSLGNDAY